MGPFMKAIIPEHDDSFAGQAMLPPQSLKALKGRGAVSNLQGRYEAHARAGFDDGWSVGGLDEMAGEEDAPSWKTQVSDEQARTILTRNASPDLPFNVSLNPYRGCEHGCIYCYARPTHSYLGLSPGLDFESRIYAKVNAPELLRRELAKPSYVAEPIAVGVSIAPIIPFVTEPEIEQLLEAVRDAGAIHAHYVVLRLPWEVSPLFQQWLEAHFPERAQRVMNRVREMRGGKDYDSAFGTRMRGQGPFADLVAMRFAKTRKRLGFEGVPPLRTDLFVAPRKPTPQGSLF